MLMFAFAKNDFGCMILNFLETIHLISGDVNEQRVAIVQTTKNERTHQMNSGFPRQELSLLISRHAERLLWSICFAIDRVASM